MPMSLNNNIQ